MGNDPNNRWPPPPPPPGAAYGAPTPYGQPASYAPPTQPQGQAPMAQYPQPYPQPQANPYAQQPYAPQYAQPYAPQPIQVVVQNQIQPNPYAAPYYAQQPYMLPPNALKKDTALLLCLLGFFFGINGMQRFYLRETGMGVLYLFTAGLCGIGQIVDAIRIGTMSQVEFDQRYNYPQLPR